MLPVGEEAAVAATGQHGNGIHLGLMVKPAAGEAQPAADTGLQDRFGEERPPLETLLRHGRLVGRMF
jgi:hypothetical protein